MNRLQIPIQEAAIRALHVGDVVYLNGQMMTARDAAHSYMVRNFVETASPPPAESDMLTELESTLRGGVIYHCGPVVAKEGEGWRFVAAGPTTSIREEVYQDLVIERFGLRGVIGKGGMGPRTLAACQKFGAVYFHAIGGAATLIADAVKQVTAVYKLEFGVPEAFWKIQVVDFPVVVTMDSHGISIHDEIETYSRNQLKKLLG